MAKAPDAPKTESPPPAGAKAPPAAPAAPPAPPEQVARVADAAGDRVARLEAALAEQAEELALFRDMLRAGAVNAVGANQEEASRRRHAEAVAWIEQGKQKITQDACDAMFGGGKHRWRCSLPDGNGHPEIVVGADHEVDAAARYKAACGIRSSEKEVQVVRA